MTLQELSPDVDDIVIYRNEFKWKIVQVIKSTYYGKRTTDHRVFEPAAELEGYDTTWEYEEDSFTRWGTKVYNDEQIREVAKMQTV